MNVRHVASCGIPAAFANGSAVIGITVCGDDLMGSQVQSGLPDTGPERQFHATVARNTDK
jgi:hypothetical protein